MSIVEVDTEKRTGRPTGARAAAREQAILDAALSLVMEVGYDRLSMDALAERAHAGKATIYRHWSGKAEVVVEAIRRRKCEHFAVPADTGTVRGDLIASLNHSREAFDEEDSALLVGVLSAMHHDQELAALMHRQIIGAKQSIFDEIVDRAVRRGEPVAPGASRVVNEVSSALFFNRVAMSGDPIDEAFVLHVVDDVILPLLRC